MYVNIAWRVSLASFSVQQNLYISLSIYTIYNIFYLISRNVYAYSSIRSHRSASVQHMHIHYRSSCFRTRFRDTNRYLARVRMQNLIIDDNRRSISCKSCDTTNRNNHHGTVISQLSFSFPKIKSKKKIILHTSHKYVT